MTAAPTDSTRAGSALPPRVLVVQPGARRHYAVPVALAQAQMLERMDTEWFNQSGRFTSSLMRLAGRLGPSSLSQLAGRQHHALDHADVGISALQTVEHLRMQRRFSSRAAGLKWYLPRAGKRTLRRGFGDASALYGFVRNIDPAVCRAARARNLRVIGDQIIAPSSVEAREIRRQLERFPGWEPGVSAAQAEEYRELDHATWAACDAITCMSSWVREGLIAEGQPAEKLWMLPYPSDHTRLHAIRRPTDRRTLTVGFVGGVGLRKGAGYFFEAARRLASDRLKFVMVGPVRLDDGVVTDQRGPVELVGPVPRGNVGQWLERFDVFYFPSTCEGSAGSVNEAMAAGLPVVTTPNSGSTIRDGIDGCLVDYDDLETTCARLTTLVESADLRAQMGAAARQRTQQYDLTWYRRELIERITALCRSSE